MKTYELVTGDSVNEEDLIKTAQTYQIQLVDFAGEPISDEEILEAVNYRIERERSNY